MNDDFGATLTFDLIRPRRLGCALPAADVPASAPPPSERRRGHPRPGGPGSCGWSMASCSPRTHPLSPVSAATQLSARSCSYCLLLASSRSPSLRQPLPCCLSLNRRGAWGWASSPLPVCRTVDRSLHLLLRRTSGEKIVRSYHPTQCRRWQTAMCCSVPPPALLSAETPAPAGNLVLTL